MSPKKPKTENSPRFGWYSCLDDDPQQVWENKGYKMCNPSAVIPLPSMDDEVVAKVREFTKSLWPKP